MYVISFLFGLLGALGVLVFELGYATIISFNGMSLAFLSLSLTSLIFFSFMEECIKFILLSKLLKGIQDLSLVFKPAIFFGFGFAGTEIALISLKYEGAISWLSLDTLLIFLLHTLLSVLLAVFISLARRYTKWLFLAGLLSAFTIHAIYNSLLKLNFM